MPRRPRLENITREAFDRRLDASNERLRQELRETQERVQQWETLIARKEAFSRKLDQILTDIERDENEIAEQERKLRPAARRYLPPRSSP